VLTTLCIRMALGARAADVLSLLLRGRMKWVLTGIGLGLVGSAGLTP